MRRTKPMTDDQIRALFKLMKQLGEDSVEGARMFLHVRLYEGLITEEQLNRFWPADEVKGPKSRDIR